LNTDFAGSMFQTKAVTLFAVAPTGLIRVI